MSVLIKFSEQQRYDINQDSEVTLFCGSISTGTYHTEIPVTSGRSLREVRNRFKETVIRMIEDGLPPQEVVL